MEVCYNWDCAAQTEVVSDDYQWLEVTRLIGLANNPAGERALVAQFGTASPVGGRSRPVIHNDRRGIASTRDAEGRGGLHRPLTTTTRFPGSLEASGALHWHRAGGTELTGPVSSLSSTLPR